MKLVDADALIDYFFAKDAICKSYANIDIKGVIDEQPEAVVRCKDCKWGEQSEFGYWLCGSLGCQMGDIDGSGFCSDGERKTDE